jgi:hypothetical protein
MAETRPPAQLVIAYADLAYADLALTARRANFRATHQPERARRQARERAGGLRERLCPPRMTMPYGTLYDRALATEPGPEAAVSLAPARASGDAEPQCASPSFPPPRSSLRADPSRAKRGSPP